VYTSVESPLHPSNEIANEETSVLYRVDENEAIAYQKSKAIADKMVLNANPKTLRASTLRLPAVYGEGDPYMVLPILKQLRKARMKFG
jgi:sterol-4alpha-carboxylate 3-dehydrogenase (decarboxylating)